MLPTNRTATRAFLLLRGMSCAPVLALLRARGCSEEVVSEGWDLLLQSNNVRLLKPRGITSQAASAHLAELQSTWFPVVDATLEARYPAIHERVFLNLGRGAGPDLYVAMQTLHDRIATLYASTDPTDTEASSLLRTRGVTADVLAEIQGGIEELKTLELPTSVVETDQAAEAETKLAAFVTEWSKIVRSAVKDRRLLFAMGFLRKPRPKKKPAKGAGSSTTDAKASSAPADATSAPIAASTNAPATSGASSNANGAAKSANGAPNGVASTPSVS